GVPFPVVLGDATRLPFDDGSFGAGLARWVFHLIQSWRDALAGLVRVVRPGGGLLILLRPYRTGPRAPLPDRLNALRWLRHHTIGIMWGDVATLDAAMLDLGASVRPLPVLTDVEPKPLSVFLDGIQQNRFSWTWRIPPEELVRVEPQVRAWAEERFGPLDRT